MKVSGWIAGGLGIVASACSALLSIGDLPGLSDAGAGDATSDGSGPLGDGSLRDSALDGSFDGSLDGRSDGGSTDAKACDDADFDVDPANCGACGRVCTTTCAGGLCAPSVVASVLQMPYYLIADDAGTLFW